MRPPNSDFIKVLRIKVLIRSNMLSLWGTEEVTVEHNRGLRLRRANGEERILQFPIKLDLERPKRPRTIFSDYQLRILEEAFKKNDYLTGEDRLALAIRLGLSDTQFLATTNMLAMFRGIIGFVQMYNFSNYYATVCSHLKTIV
ncbi:homeobox domain protein [Dictyocaulus viviparus]|uniref:Homeobox domain protein n=1 Tax=Dictyocaulus viviparus TaxID=29172 RepID=A0A0D8XW26_DICVI|nr:homeobox domain protein [Dictyocaulus viviparus]